MTTSKPDICKTCGKRLDDSWKEIFRIFYDDNETGGSSRWRVTPMSVELFIMGLLGDKPLPKNKKLKKEDQLS